MTPEPSPNPSPRAVLVLLIGEALEDPRVLRTCRSLRDMGADVTVGCTNLSGRVREEVRDGIHIIRFPHRRESLLKRAYLWFQGRLKPEYSRVFAHMHEDVSGSRVKAALRNLALRLNFRSYLRGTRSINRRMIRAFQGTVFDLVHANDVDTLMAGVALKRSGVGRELLYDSHEYWPGIGVLGSFSNEALRRLEASGISHADYVVTVNPLIAEVMHRDYRLDRMPAVVMNCPGRDLDSDPPDETHNPVRVLYQGKVQAFRGVEQLVLAFHDLEGAELTVAGDGPLLERFRRFTDSEGLSGRVRFTGRYSHEDTFAITRKHDIGVLPSSPVNLNTVYSSPNKLFDYAMGGLAVASVDLPFLRGVIEGRRMGMLFPDNRPESIAGVLREMISDRERLREFKRNARRAALDLFSWEKQFEQYPWKISGDR